MIHFVAKGERALERHAATFATALRPGALLALEGELGAGKTVFTRGLADGLGHDPNAIASPSFVMAVEHRGGTIPLLHVDLYRLAEGASLDDLGIEEALAAGWIVAVEWGQRLPRSLWKRARRIAIVQAPGQSENERSVTIFPDPSGGAL